MSAVPPLSDPFAPPANSAKPRGKPSVLGRQWHALHRAAGAVAAMAGVEVELDSPAISRFPEAVLEVQGWRRSLAEQGVADLAAVMEPGLNALISVHSRGGDAHTPARTLLQEFAAARDALLVLAPGPGELH
ncbi:MAG: hypothetical protein JSS36_10315 [Proteobacteria bacterium]|nr:hypothetical protein [Pseudomonadota bacterium]